MNKIYRLVWNRELNAMVVASELAKGDSGGVVAAPRRALLPGVLNAAIIFSLLGLTPQQAAASGRLYINDGNDPACAFVQDGGNMTADTNVSYTAGNNQTGAVGVAGYASSNCYATDRASQTNRAVFYNQVTQNGATSLSLGGELFVNSGNLGIGGGQDGNLTNSIRIGSAATLNPQNLANPLSDTQNINYFTSNNVSGQNSIAIGASSSATIAAGNDSIAFGSGAKSGSGGATVSNTVAIGLSSEAITYSDSVALGSNSIASVNKGVVGYDPKTGVASTQTSGTWKSTLAAVSIGKADGTVTRQITGLAAGTADTDAVNVAQLKNATTHFYSVNNSTTTTPNYKNDGATGTNALAAGVATTALGASSTANGASAAAIGNNSVALGGGGTITSTGSGTANWTGANCTASTADGLGRLVCTDGGAKNGLLQYSTYRYAATGTSGALAVGVSAVSIGYASAAQGDHSLAVGERAVASITGTQNATKSAFATALGYKATATSTNTTSVGANAAANSASAVAIGMNAQAGGTTTTGDTINKSAIAIGDNATATSLGSIAIGGTPSATRSVGNTTFAAGEYSIAIGNKASTAQNNALALGQGALANVAAGDVALGSGSTTAAVNKGTLTINSNIVAAGASDATTPKNAVGVLSVGSSGNERQIQNVAPGVLSSASTDAINGSQLYATNQQVLANTTAMGQTTGTSTGGTASSALTYNTTTKTWTAPNFVVTNGTPSSGTTVAVNTVGAALTNLNTAVMKPITVTGNDVSGTTGAAGSTQTLGSTLNITGGLATATGSSNANVKTVVTDGKVDIQIANAPTFSGKVTSDGLDAGSGNITTKGSVNVTNASGTTIASLTTTPIVVGGTTYTDVNSAINAAANGGAGWQLQTNAGASKTVKPGDTVQVLDGANTKVSALTTTNLNATGQALTLASDGKYYLSADVPGGAGTAVNATNSGVQAVAKTTQSYHTDVVGLPVAYVDSSGNQLVNVGGQYYRATDVINGVPKAGATPVSIPSNGFALSTVGAGGAVSPYVAATYNADGTVKTAASGGTVISNVADPVNAGDATNKAYVDKANADLGKKGLNFTGNGNSVTAGVHLDLGGTLPVIGATTTDAGTTLALSTATPTAGAYSAKNVQTYADATSGKLQIQIADNPVFSSVTTGADASGNTTVMNGAGTTVKNTDGRTASYGIDGSSIKDVAGNTTTVTSTGVTLQGATPSGGTAPSPVSLTTTGLNNGGNTITNVGNAVNATDAVNKQQLDAVSASANAGWQLQTNAGASKTVKPGDQVQVVDGANTKVSALTETLNVNAAGQALVVANDGKYYLATDVPGGAGTAPNAGAVAQTALTRQSYHTDVVGLPLAYKNAAGDQLVNVGGTYYKASDVTNGVPSSTALAQTPANAMNVLGGGGTLMAYTAATYNADGTVKVAASGGTTLTGVASPTNASDAANKDYVDGLGKKGLNFTGNGNSVTAGVHLDLGGTLPVIGATTTDAGTTLALSTATPTAGAYSAKNVQTYADATSGKLQIQIADNPVFTGVTITNGPVLSNTGIAMSNLKISGMANGTAASDAVNFSQLSPLATALGATINATSGAVSAPVYTVGGNTYNTVSGALNALSAAGGKQSTVTQGNNIVVTTTTNADGSSNYQVATSDTPTFTSVGVTNGPTMSSAGIDMAGTKISNLGAGAVTSTSTDAVNGSQLFAVTQVIGGVGSGPAGTGTQPTVPGSVGDLYLRTYNAAGQRVVTDNNVVTAIQNMNDQGIQYFHTNLTGVEKPGQIIETNDSSAYAARSTAIGVKAVVGSGATNSLAIGYMAMVGDGALDSIAIGPGAQANGEKSISIGNGNVVNGNRSGSLGDPSYINGDDAYGIGNNNTINANRAFVMGNNVTVSAGLDGAVVLGNGSTVSAATPTSSATAGSLTYGTFAGSSPAAGDVVSVGSTGAPRQVQNVAAGQINAGSTDAINGSQLYATQLVIGNVADSAASALGTTVGPDGKLVAPNYNVAGNSYNNVKGAIDALNNATAGVANGTSGLVQQSGGISPANANPITVGANTGGSEVKFNNASGENRVLTGVAAGSTTADSTQAVNGSQLNKLASSTASNLGGGSSYNANIGIVTAPTFVIGGSNYNNVGSALDAVNSQLSGMAGNMLVQQSGTPGAGNSNALTVGGFTGGTVVNFANAAGGTRTLSNVSAGVAPTDAVNVKQLTDGLAGARAYTDQRVNALAGDVWTLRRDMRGAAASSMAAAGLPQAYLPGKSMLSAAVGGYQGQYGIAIGLSGITENGRWVYKAQASSNTAHDIGFSIGAGIQW